LTAMLLHQSNGTLTDFRRKFVVLAHGSIFSKVGASSKPGAIQPVHRGRTNPEPIVKNDSGLLLTDRIEQPASRQIDN
ncbi:hypothetical protein KTE58_26095, partial [Burkholderia multivorans]|uniref:hypothetical protein n=1 Tax=Burkholderia multivorans TaxID=87883 RepID=UPI001C277F92